MMTNVTVVGQIIYENAADTGVIIEGYHELSSIVQSYTGLEPDHVLC